MAAQILNNKCIYLSQSDSVQDDDVRERFKGCVEGSRVRDKIESGQLSGLKPFNPELFCGRAYTE